MKLSEFALASAVSYETDATTSFPAVNLILSRVQECCSATLLTGKLLKIVPPASTEQPVANIACLQLGLGLQMLVLYHAMVNFRG